MMCLMDRSQFGQNGKCDANVMQSKVYFTNIFFLINISSLIDWFSVGRLTRIGYDEMVFVIPFCKLVTVDCDSLICV